MPSLTRWFVKTSFVYLLVALLAGLCLALQSLLDLPGLGGLFPVYIHLLVLGWLTQLIFGIVFWMFPKQSQERPRGSETLGWWTYGLLNLGLILRSLAEPINSAQPNGPWGWLLLVAATTMFLAGACFVINTWGRVRSR